MGIKLAGNTVSQQDLEDLSTWMREGHQLTKGPVTAEFEDLFAQQVGAHKAVFVNSGSSANLLAVAVAKQSGRLRNLKALCPAVAWVTTVTPFLQLGFDVRLVEADSQNLGLDLNDLEIKMEQHRPSILILVHVLGHANQMPEILALCQKYGVFLVEDSCEALGSTDQNNRSLGTLGDIGTYSFYYGHHISTIEGGMAVTNDDELYQLMLSVRSHGWSRDLAGPHQRELRAEWEIDEFANFYTFYFQGFNLRSTDLQAKLGISQLARLPEITDKREENFEIYKSLLPNFWAQSSDSARISSFAFGTFVHDRLSLSKHLANRGIESRPLICGNLGRHPFWLRDHSPFAAPVADLVHSQGLYLPNHAELTRGEIETICSVVNEFSKPVNVGVASGL